MLFVEGLNYFTKKTNADQHLNLKCRVCFACDNNSVYSQGKTLGRICVQR